MPETLTLIKIENISPNPYQPRLEFKQEELEELARSIKANGLFSRLSSENQLSLVMSLLLVKDV